MTEDYQPLIILREKRDYGALEGILEKKFFRLYHVPVFHYEFLSPLKRPPASSALLFSSRAGVRPVSSLLRQMENAHCFVIGEDTQNALRAAGFSGKIERFLTIQDFLAHLVQTKRKDIKAVHYYRGEVVKNPNINQHISALGLGYSEDIVYKTGLIKEIPESILALMKESRRPLGYVAVSERAMRHWDNLIFYHCLVPSYRKGRLFCLSKDVACGSRVMQQSSTTVPLEPTTTSLIACIQSYYKYSPPPS
jgi:uroporphyrinogen-III synthase